jgi:hypothetical protein
MNKMIWNLKADVDEYIVEYTAKPYDDEVMVDGQAVSTRSSYWLGVLMQKSFKIDGKLVKIRRRSLWHREWELVYNKTVYTAEGAK